MHMKAENANVNGMCKCAFSTRNTGVNFTNILRAAFLCESLVSSFSVLTFRFVIFGRKEIGAKAARKMLVKLTPGGDHSRYNTPTKILVQ